MKPFLLIVTTALSLSAQTLHVTADILQPATTAAMFGKLPKLYSAANVSVCNLTSNPQTVALALAAQQIALPGGIVMLPKDAALSVIAAAQGSSKWGTASRIGVTLVGLAAIGTGLSSVSATVKAILTETAIAGDGAITLLSTTVPSHTYLVLSNEALPDPIQLVPLGCVSGVVIVESATSKTRIDASVNLPKQ